MRECKHFYVSTCTNSPQSLKYIEPLFGPNMASFRLWTDAFFDVLFFHFRCIKMINLIHFIGILKSKSNVFHDYIPWQLTKNLHRFNFAGWSRNAIKKTLENQVAISKKHWKWKSMRVDENSHESQLSSTHTCILIWAGLNTIWGEMTF